MQFRCIKFKIITKEVRKAHTSSELWSTSISDCVCWILFFLGGSYWLCNKTSGQSATIFSKSSKYSTRQITNVVAVFAHSLLNPFFSQNRQGIAEPALTNIRNVSFYGVSKASTIIKLCRRRMQYTVVRTDKFVSTSIIPANIFYQFSNSKGYDKQSTNYLIKTWRRQGAVWDINI